MFEGFKGEERGTPGKGSDNVLVTTEDIECSAYITAREEAFEDPTSIVV